MRSPQCRCPTAVGPTMRRRHSSSQMKKPGAEAGLEAAVAAEVGHRPILNLSPLPVGFGLCIEFGAVGMEGVEKQTPPMLYGFGEFDD